MKLVKGWEIGVLAGSLYREKTDHSGRKVSYKNESTNVTKTNYWDSWKTGDIIMQKSKIMTREKYNIFRYGY